ncbi:MAG TPA: phosphopantetheine-binding protein [Planctomycetota bacterium]|jgi:acyl carrier protein|nr:phosphopantetheine-binding protein [Planctomycetota bacterium]
MTDTNDDVLRSRVKTMIVECARLKIQPSELKDDAPLFDKEKGLGLDSIDVLELVVNIEKSFGVQIPDRETGQKVLQTVNTIVEHLKASGVKS